MADLIGDSPYSGAAQRISPQTMANRYAADAAARVDLAAALDDLQVDRVEFRGPAEPAPAAGWLSDGANEDLTVLRSLARLS